jgi:hypothetical protein
MAGGVLQIVGLLALLIGGCELVVRRQRRRALPDPLYGYPPRGEVHCPWPRLEPEVELLRRKGAL